MINKNIIINYNKDGFTTSQIHEKTGYSRTTINKVLKENGLYNNITNPERYLKDIDYYLNLNYTNSQIADILHLSKTTVRKYTNKFLNKNTNSIKKKSIIGINLQLSNLQYEVLYGTLLGDSNISRHASTARFTISHGGKQLNYFKHKLLIFKDIIGKEYIKDIYDKRTNKFYCKCSAHSLSNKLFLDIYNKLYINNIKTITPEYLNLLTPRSLAYWFMDDGNKSGILATNCFSLKECKLIHNWLKETYNISSTIEKNNKNQYLIYLDSNGKKIFYELTYQYFIPEMLYKIKGWNPKKSSELRETPLS